MDKIGAEVWYLFNSGFAVKKGQRLFIFDYYNVMPFKRRKEPDSGVVTPAALKGLDGGVVTPAAFIDLEVTVFASHAHMDHFIPSILKWGQEHPNIRYVLSSDIDAGQTANVTSVNPNETYTLEGIKVRTLKSTDEGVAFIVEADDLKLYHAGDLNWWHWEGEPDADNKAMGVAYKAEIEKLEGETFDLAFIPVDPRLDKEYLWGLDYFMQKADATVIFPMHFRNSYAVQDRLQRDPATEKYRDRVVRLSRRGERFEV